MFQLSREEIKSRRAAKPIQFTEEMCEALGFSDLVESGMKVEMSTAFNEFFERYARIVNPKGGGEKLYAFSVYQIIEFMCIVWADLYGTVTTSCKEVMRDKSLLKQEVWKLSEGEKGREGTHWIARYLASADAHNP